MRHPSIRRSLSSIFGIALVVSSVAAYDGVLLQRRAKAGDLSEYKVVAEFDTPQGAIKLSQTQAQKIVSVRADGSFSLQSANTNSVVEIPGGKTPQVVKQPDETSKSEHLANGRTLSITTVPAASAASYRLAHLREFEAPVSHVAIGGSIKYTIPADAALSTPPVLAEYKLISVEKVKNWSTAKLTFTASETEGTSKSSMAGTTWINLADGSVIKTEAEWKSIELPGVPAPLDGKFNLERLK